MLFIAANISAQNITNQWISTTPFLSHTSIKKSGGFK